MLPMRFILKLLVRLVLPDRFVRSDILAMAGVCYSNSVCKSVHVAVSLTLSTTRVLICKDFSIIRGVTFRLIQFSGYSTCFYILLHNYYVLLINVATKMCGTLYISRRSLDELAEDS